MTTECAPCVWGPVAASLLSYPTISSRTSSSALFITTISGNAPSTSTSTLTALPTTAATTTTANQTTGVVFNTVTGGPIVVSSSAVATAVVVINTLGSGQWSAYGTVMTSPTTYAMYTEFGGAAVTGTGCANSLPLTAFVFNYLPRASLIYPYDSTGILPSALVEYLDSNVNLTQYNFNNRLSQCSELAAVGMSSASSSSASVMNDKLSSASASPSTSLSSSSSSTSQTPGPTTPSDTLTAGASAGIGVGVTLGVVLLCVGGVLGWLWRRRRSRQAAALSTIEEKRGDEPLGGERAAELDAKQAAVAELDPDGLAEMGAGEGATELEAQTQPPAELKGHHTEHELP